MSINKSYQAAMAKKEIEQLISKRQVNEYLRNDCGSILDKLGRQFGYEVPNKIIQELKLDIILNLQIHCPAQEILKSKIKKD